MGNLSDLDPVARALAEYGEDVVVDEVDVHDLVLHVFATHIVALR